MKYCRALVAAILAGVAFSASAQDADVVVDSAETCPAGTFASVPSYDWEDGRFVRDGWLCESLYKGGA
jgi:hypothetical protein